jgi:carbamoyltransferase
MIHWGINSLNHGSSIAVFHNERFVSSSQSAQDTLPDSFIQNELKRSGRPDRIFWYEQPWVKKARQFKAGQYDRAFDMSVLPSRSLKAYGLGDISVTYTPHHASHAAAGYYTSPFNHCAVVVLDAIGEFECATIWEGRHGELKKVWSQTYPNSLGLFYSAFTKFVGLQPIRDEYLFQQMAERGNPKKFKDTIAMYFKPGLMEFDYNFHQGVGNWSCENWTEQEKCDLAAAVQDMFELQVMMVMYKAKQLIKTNNLVYMGGCAMNSRANKQVVKQFSYTWSLPNPGDPSSAMGAVLYHTKQRIQHNFGLVKHIEIKV